MFQDKVEFIYFIVNKSRTLALYLNKENNITGKENPFLNIGEFPLPVILI